ncbi:NAD-dependent protein deacylase [Aquibacillus albus]|uniref:protein acetyllysine N-acetyltransferase n=1 Tax=Aquibacillus albus TaxID=1168171 RepID=A0ABS2MYC0_9BACI|nr:NAD-dependent protein deacylase [Aquibacillus albus]MBM7570675.1 NAD-dependent SIR2 family protein deacetylase [Aquibacillus albus]
MQLIKALADKLNQAETITCLTGAGVSTASGIPDFRSTNGYWKEGKSREYYMSREYFFHDPEDFWNKYKDIFRLKLLKNFEPNNVHLFLKQLEKNHKKVHIVTQNVDGLHRAAGSKSIIEYHGNLNTASCPRCGASYSLDYVMQEKIPVCNQKACEDILKPDIVLFGDPITEHGNAESVIQQSDFILVMGTSLLVSPFNLLPSFAMMECNIPGAIINRDATEMDALFEFVIHDDLVRVTNQLKNYVK